MLDDIRNHDPRPTEEESAWTQVDGVGAALRASALAVIALVIGLGASILVEDEGPASNVVVFGPR